MRIVTLAFVVVALFSSTTHAETPPVTIGNPTYRGPGCPPDSVDAVFVPDYSAISIAFSDMTVQSLPRENERQGCRISIPIRVARGVRVLIMDSDFEGFLSLPKNARAHFYAIYRLLQGTKLRGFDVVYETATGPYDGSFLVEEGHDERIKSPCGGDFTLDLDISMGLVNASKTAAASFTIDSTNLAAYPGSMYFYLTTQKCK